MINQNLDDWKEFDALIANTIKNIFSDNLFQSKRFDWLDTLFTTLIRKNLTQYSQLKIVHETVNMILEDFLDYLFDDKYFDPDGRNRFVEMSSSEKSLFASVESDKLINWCKEKNDIEIWNTIALGIPVLNSESNQIYQLTEIAKKYLFESPERSQVLNSYIRVINRRAELGEISTKLEAQLDAFKELLECGDYEIIEIAKSAINNAERIIEEQKKIEKRLEKRFESGFE